MLSEKNRKAIQALRLKKNRSTGLFVAENEKVIEEFLKEGFEPIHFYTTQITEDQHLSSATLLSTQEMKSLSQLQQSASYLAVFQYPINTDYQHNSFDIYLDNIRDPGNLGTLIRLADWYGLGQIFCSIGTADPLNTKVVQASMGSLARVQVVSCQLQDIKKHYTVVLGADTEGKSIYEYKAQKPCLLVIGNEGNGISEEHKKLIDEYVSIPRRGGAESLNAAVAGAILIDRIISTQ